MTAKKYVESAWDNNSTYPERRGVCEFCNQRDNLKLSFDRIRYICKNEHACLLRWIKSREER